MTAGTFPDVRRNSSDAQSPTTPTDALVRGKEFGTYTVHNSYSEDADALTEDQPILPLQWTLQGRLGATEEALHAADALLTTDMFQDNELLLEQSATLRLLETTHSALLKVSLNYHLCLALSDMILLRHANKALAPDCPAKGS